MAFNRFKQREGPKRADPKNGEKSGVEQTITPSLEVSVNPYVSLKKALELITRISSARISAQFENNLREVNEVLKEAGFFEFVHENRKILLNPDLYTDLRQVLFSLLSAIDNESFGNKPRVKVVVAGQYNAGKSSFLNYLINKSILPSGIEPATSVPTFLFCQKQINDLRVYGENKSGAVLGLDENVLKFISHDTKSDTAHQIASTLNRFIVEIPHNEYENIVFIDTPGFGNKDNDGGSRDDAVASEQMDSSEMMLYLIPSQDGAIKENHWDIIDSFGNRPVVLVLTKNDLVSADNAKEIFDLVCSNVDSHSNVVDVISMSAFDDNRFFSKSGLSLSEAMNRHSSKAKRGTEIERAWDGIASLLNAEIEASNDAVEKLTEKYIECKTEQNDNDKSYHEISNDVDNILSQVKETLIDDINKSINALNVTFKILVQYQDSIADIYNLIKSYYSNRFVKPGSLELIINTFNSVQSIYSKKIDVVNVIDSSFYNEEHRNWLVSRIEFSFNKFKEQLQEECESKAREAEDNQKRRSVEKDMINHFNLILSKLKSWKDKKVMSLTPVAYQFPQPIPKLNVFDAIEEMDSDVFIEALSHSTDITTMYNDDGYSTITYAAACGNIPALRLMLGLKSKGKVVKMSFRDKNGRTMIDAAKENNQRITVSFLEKYFSQNRNIWN